MKLINIFRTWIFFFGLLSILNGQASFTVASSTVSPEMYDFEKIQISFFGHHGKIAAINLLNIIGY